MRTGRPKSVLSINEEERAQLLSIVRARSLPSALTQRARLDRNRRRHPRKNQPTLSPNLGDRTLGRRCITQQDFARAREDGAFPVRYYWETPKARKHR
jgi:hypothetical protein